MVAPAEHFGRVEALLPPGFEPCDPERLEASIALSASESGAYALSRDGRKLAEGLELEIAMKVLERELHSLVALEAPNHVFVHAGVVASGGVAAVLPGESLAGKTTLVAALVRAGAVYYSDEFAPLDRDGLVHPFAKPVSLRDDRFAQIDHPIDALGGVAGEKPLRVGAVVVTKYDQGAEWRPRQLTAGEAALALLSHTVPAQSRPAQVLRTITRSIEGALVVEGARGEAGTVAPLVLAELERASATERPRASARGLSR